MNFSLNARREWKMRKFLQKFESSCNSIDVCPFTSKFPFNMAVESFPLCWIRCLLLCHIIVDTSMRNCNVLIMCLAKCTGWRGVSEACKRAIAEGDWQRGTCCDNHNRNWHKLQQPSTLMIFGSSAMHAIKKKTGEEMREYLSLTGKIRLCWKICEDF